MLSMAAEGINNVASSGPMAGVDLRWRTPFEGLSLGASYASARLSAPHAAAGPIPLPIQDNYTQQGLNAQFERGKWTLSGEWKVNPIHFTMGPAPATYMPMRGWYTMASYRATAKLTFGSYYDQTWFFKSNRDSNDPANHLKDVAVSTRFDINRYFYFKLEGHYMDGNAAGFASQVNPNGLEKTTWLSLARVGFAF